MLGRHCGPIQREHKALVNMKNSSDQAWASGFAPPAQKGLQQADYPQRTQIAGSAHESQEKGQTPVKHKHVDFWMASPFWPLLSNTVGKLHNHTVRTRSPVCLCPQQALSPFCLAVIHHHQGDRLASRTQSSFASAPGQRCRIDYPIIGQSRVDGNATSSRSQMQWPNKKSYHERWFLPAIVSCLPNSDSGPLCFCYLLTLCRVVCFWNAFTKKGQKQTLTKAEAPNLLRQQQLFLHTPVTAHQQVARSIESKHKHINFWMASPFWPLLSNTVGKLHNHTVRTRSPVCLCPQQALSPFCLAVIHHHQGDRLASRTQSSFASAPGQRCRIDYPIIGQSRVDGNATSSRSQMQWPNKKSYHERWFLPAIVSCLPNSDSGPLCFCYLLTLCRVVCFWNAFTKKGQKQTLTKAEAPNLLRQQQLFLHTPVTAHQQVARSIESKHKHINFWMASPFWPLLSNTVGKLHNHTVRTRSPVCLCPQQALSPFCLAVIHHHQGDRLASRTQSSFASAPGQRCRIDYPIIGQSRVDGSRKISAVKDGKGIDLKCPSDIQSRIKPSKEERIFVVLDSLGFAQISPSLLQRTLLESADCDVNSSVKWRNSSAPLQESNPVTWIVVLGGIHRKVMSQNLRFNLLQDESKCVSFAQP